MRNARVAAVAFAALVAACSPAREAAPPHNADERLADDVMVALLASDMHPVVRDFVPERKPDLLDPKHVALVRSFVANSGRFLGVRETSLAHKHALTRYFIATFSGGDVAVTMLMDGAGKIVHYHVGGALSDS